jgi:hypothetical protein
MDPQLAALVAQVTLCPQVPGVIVGEPAVLKAICARLGFRNDCKRGRVYLTDAKRRALGLAPAVSR